MSNTFSNIKTYKGIAVFILGNREYCINVANIYAIIKPEELDTYYEKMISQNSYFEQYNKTIPLIDIKSVFGLEPPAITMDSRILLIDCHIIILGLCVEKVTEIITLDMKEGENKLSFIPVEGNIYIDGVINYENRLLMSPNYEKICSRIVVD